MERQSRENATPVICPHCGQKLVASQSHLGAADQAIRENASMTCPTCGQAFYRTDVEFSNVDIAGDEDPENDE